MTKIFSGSNADLGLNNSRLPNERGMRSFFNQFTVTDPYNHPGMPDWKKVIRTELSRHDYDSDYNEENTQIQAVGISDGWVGNTFRSKIIPAKRMKAEENCHLEVEDWCDIPASALGMYRSVISDTRDGTASKISQGRQLSTHWQERAFDKYKSFQMKHLIRTIHAQGFTRVRSEPEIQKEIETRRKQFPGEQIYCLLGRKMVDYFRNIYRKPHWNQALLISPDGYCYLDGLETYDSAVFAHCQVRASHQFHFYYSIHKVPRWWRYRWLSIMEFSLEVDERIEEPTKLKKNLPASLARFTAE